MSEENLAAPAPKVDPAVAESAVAVEPAEAETAFPSGPAKIQPVEPVGAAVPFDNPQQFAPTTGDGRRSSKVSVDSLRGDGGSDFESYAAVLRGAPPKDFLKRCLPCIYDERDFITYGEVKKFVLIKGSNCFVFLEQSDNNPIYAIPLQEVLAILEDRDNPDKCSITVSPMPGTNKPKPSMVTVLLKYKKDRSQAYQFTFDTNNDATLARRFMDAVEKSYQMGSGTVTASVLKAESKALTAKEAQPQI